ncbi:MAG: sensor histidine kinase, partial [Devosia sp.]
MRRRSHKAVAEARQRLTSSSGTRAAFDFELLDEYARSRISGALAIPVLIVILAAFSSLWVPPLLAGLWAVMVVGTNSAVVLLCRRFKRI